MEMMKKKKAAMNDPLLTQVQCTKCPCRLHAPEEETIQREEDNCGSEKGRDREK